jgi:glycosyltransferase involved in cell wall biosynthesis
VADVTCVYSDFVAASLPQDVRAKAIKIALPFDCAAIAAVGRSTKKAERFTFVTVFDFCSYPQRKGPQRAIAAFKQAFNAAEPVRLIVKSMHGDEMPEQFAALKQMAADDPRITFVDAEWSTEETLTLLAQAHVFLSLHASEGFGRLLAESMLLDTLVIATDYSGSTEICRRDTALTLPYELVPIGPQDYLLGDGQHWARPDEAAAAEAMRHALHHWHAPELAAMRRRARERVQQNFSLEVTAATLRDLFDAGWRRRAAAA